MAWADQASAAMSDYCQTPPFLGTTAAPNVLLMVDTSGSMGWKAYSYGDSDGPDADTMLDGYDPTRVYEGYFDPVKSYTLVGGVYQEAVGACTVKCGAANNQWTCSSNNNGCYYFEAKGTHGCAANKYACCTQANLIAVACGAEDTGNYLNYKNMTRMDVLRWALTGGKPDGCNNSIQTCEPSLWQEASSSVPCDAAGCTMMTENGIKVKVTWDRITGDHGGLLYQLKNLTVQPRMGSMYFSGDGVTRTVLVGDFTGSASIDGVNPYKNTVTALNDESPGGSTPIGPALWAAYAYLAQNASVFGSPTPQTGVGAEWKNPMYQCFDSDNNGNCQGNELVLVPCAKNFMIVLTDGQWNRGGTSGSVTSTCSIDTGYESASADPVVPAYWLHKKGYTNSPTGIASKVEAIYGVGLWLGGTGENSLKHVAMYGGFDTSSKTWPGNMTDYPKVAGCAAADCGAAATKGSPCTPLPPSSSDWDKDADNIPDTFYSASDAAEIKQNIMKIILEILRRASSGTAVSVLSSSEGSGANLMQALFYPSRSFEEDTEVAWTSDLMNYWYYMDPFFTFSQIREDTVRENAAYTLLDLKKDYITNFAFDSAENKTMARRWWDTAGTGTVLTDMGRVPIENTLPIWRAGYSLWQADPADRTIKTTVNGSSLIDFTTANYTTLDDYMGLTASSVDAKTTINYVRGYDCVDSNGDSCTCGTAGCTKLARNRTVTAKVCSSRKSACNADSDCPTGETCDTETHVWKLGDIISSTPRIMGPSYLNTFNMPSPFGYNDQSYSDFIKSTDYKDRELVFAGANDGMLHAFKLGKLRQNWSGKQWFEAAKQEGTLGVGGIGSESYAFIPKNVLPYLRYLAESDYCHIYMVDGPVALTEAAINKSSTCTLADYWNCPKQTTMQAAPNSDRVDFAKTSWRTTLVGSMGIGGATCDAASPDADRISTPVSVGGSPVGWSSYFALDVTDQASPQLLWEYSNADLGVSNVGPAVVRTAKKECTISKAECTTDSDCGVVTTNGTCAKVKRCAISNAVCNTNLDCGDTATNGQCVEENGRWFAVLANGATGPITNKEFKGTSDKNLKLFVLDLKTGALLRTIDTGITNAFAGSISTNALDLEKDRPSDGGNYQDDAVYIGYVKGTTSGGVLRLNINDAINPANWTVSKVIENIGPVTTSVVNLLDRANRKLWLYFAEGRFFYKQDDLATQRRQYGIQEPCFDATNNRILPTCTTSVTLAELNDQTTTPSTTLLATDKGWYVNMDAATATTGAERVISNPTPDPLGAIYFLSFAPTSDICNFGGTTYLWALDYATGSRVTFVMQGKALVQVSTGEIKELALSSAFTASDNRKSAGFTGIPPTGQGLMVVTNPTPLKKFMHIQEQ
ncbi:MAG: hypothetical protein AB1413_10155 [Thermodesulfobacteriota bacterium]